MSPLNALALAISISLIISTIVTLIMTEPLRVVLRQLCLDSNSTAFWIPFTTVMFYVTPMLFTLLFESTIVLPELGNTLRTALVVGYQIARARPVAR